MHTGDRADQIQVGIRRMLETFYSRSSRMCEFLFWTEDLIQWLLNVSTPLKFYSFPKQ
jgi:hypothetical protein